MRSAAPETVAPILQISVAMILWQDQQPVAVVFIKLNSMVFLLSFHVYRLLFFGPLGRLREVRPQ